jgi:hypothetical protein
MIEWNLFGYILKRERNTINETFEMIESAWISLG